MIRGAVMSTDVDVGTTLWSDCVVILWGGLVAMMLVSCWMILCVLYDHFCVHFLSSSFYYLLCCNYYVDFLGDCGYLAVCREQFGGARDVDWSIFCTCNASLQGWSTSHQSHVVPMLCVRLKPQKLTLWFLVGLAVCYYSRMLLQGLYRWILRGHCTTTC